MNLADVNPTILTPADPGWDQARLAWNLAVDQRPAAIALPESAEQVAAVVRYATDRGLQVAAQGTGHNAGPLGDLSGTVLLKTQALRRVSIDPDARIARVEAGVIMRDLAQAAGKHGLAVLMGSSPDVGVVGYALGGGMSWLGRAHGLMANHVRSLDVVTADGRLIRVDEGREPDLFWALRGGGGSFAIVTALEIGLLPVAEVYAGQLWWPAQDGEGVLRAWQELTRSGLPDQFTTTFRYLRVPPAPEIPEHLRGKSFAVVDAFYLGSPADADVRLDRLRSMEPVSDTFRMVPAADLSDVHGDPDHPVPVMADGMLLASLPDKALDEIVRLAGAGAASPLMVLELRHVGGEMSRSRPGHGALDAVHAPYLLVAGDLAPDAEAVAAVHASVAGVLSAMSPWAARQMYLNLAETPRDPAAFWSAQAYDRLRQIKAAVDPGNVIRSNHPIPAAA
jgi:FAD/FMN-containing dehydrogenase